MSITRRNFGRSAAAGVLGFLRPVQGAVRPVPKLVVVLIAEQFRSDYLDRVDRQLSPGGFRRMIDEGSSFTDCHAAASTFTCSALATLASGCWPQVHGIVGDAWYDRAEKAAIRARPGAMLAPTLAAEAAAVPRTRVFLAGTDETHVGMLEGARRVTENVYIDAEGQYRARGDTPAWLVEYNRLHPLENVRNAKWMALGAGPGVPPLRTLDFDSAHPERFLPLYRSSPFAQAAQFEFVRELIAHERLGQGETRDLLIVSLGSMALLGYEVGADSPLMDQMTLHLDREIGFTIDSLNKAPGPGNYAVAFAGAHGAPPAPDPRQRATMAVSGEALARAVDSGLSARYDAPPARNLYVEKYVYPFLYLRAEAFRGRNAREVRLAAARAAVAQPAVAGFLTADGDCSYGGEWERRFRNSYHVVRSGDVMLQYHPGYVEEYGAGRGVSYGSLYNYDVRVPLFLYGAVFRPRIFEQNVDTIHIAPTLARCTGLAPPASTTGRVLDEAFAEFPRPVRK